MSFDFHVNALSKLCRCCGNRLQNKNYEKRKFLHCCDCRKEISLIFNINTWADIQQQHPPCICNNCARKVRHLQAGTRQYTCTSTDSTDNNWPPHTRTSKCKVCTLFKEQSQLKGNIAKTKCSLGEHVSSSNSLPFRITNDNIFAHFLTQESTDVSPHLDFLVQRDEHSMFTCTLCQCIISLPSVQTPCEHYFCSSCLSDYFKFMENSSVKCPSCQQVVTFNNVTESPRLLQVQLKNLDVVCYTCSTIGKLVNLTHHSCAQLENLPPKKQKCTIVEIVPTKDDVAEAAKLLQEYASQHPPDKPIPQAIQKATDKWTWMKLSQQGKAAVLHTGGRVS